MLLFWYLEHAVPTDSAFFLVHGEPYKHGFSYDMVLRHKSPITRVGGVMAVVTHHPIIIHGEGIAGGRLAVDENFVVFDLQVMEFVSVDDTLIERQVFKGELHGLALLWNIDGTIVVDIPWV
jgi:hypothetical protein